MTDTLTISITQTGGDTLLSSLTLEYPGLPNAIANRMQLELIDAIREQAGEWASSKAAAPSPEEFVVAFAHGR